MNSKTKNTAGQVNDLEILAAQYLVRREFRAAFAALADETAESKRRFEIAVKAVQFAH